MQKELNPELFGGPSVPSSRLVEPEGSGLASGLVQLEQRYLELKAQMSGSQDQSHRWMSQMAEFAKSTHAKMERMQQHIVKVEQALQALTADSTQKASYFQSKLAERKSSDLKLQEMVDRHNSILRSYEVRMSQLQKLIAERESQITQSQAALNEAKMEIARLKRL